MQVLDRVPALLAEEQLLAAANGASILALTGAPKVVLPPHVREAAHAAIEEGEVRLPSRGLPRLRTALTEVLSRTTGRWFNADSEILVTNGAMHALNVVLRALLNEDDEVLIPAPAFMFDGVLSAAGVRARYIRTSDSVRWAWDLGAIENAVTRDTRAVLVCNPENPSGYVPDEETVRKLSSVASEHRLLLIADESYARFVYQPARHMSFVAIGDPKRLVVVGSMSKGYGLSSWRVGFLAADEMLVQRCLPTLEWDSIRCAYVSQAAAAAAVAGPQEWMDRIVDAYKANRDAACAMRVPELRIPRPDGGAFLFLRMGSVEPLHQAGIPAVPGEAFQMPGFVRIPFGGPAEAIGALESRLARLMTPLAI